MKKQQERETGVLIYDILQGNVATRYRYGGTCDYYFTAHLVVTLL